MDDLTRVVYDDPLWNETRDHFLGSSDMKERILALLWRGDNEHRLGVSRIWADTWVDTVVAASEFLGDKGE